MKTSPFMAIACLLCATTLTLAEDTPTVTKPIILLTGFEPFGAGRPPNPSWEGVRRLDGKEWRGHKLVARQLPVVWGEPLKKLEPWMKELAPVAVFSFGQGGGYALETKAENRRAEIPDNEGERPGETKIVANGPDVLTATIKAEPLVAALAKRDYRVAISREAGNYLCEECLYTLEYLKERDRRDTHVLFCHVPPLVEGRYEAEDVERFVTAMLEAWHQAHVAAK